MNLLRAGRIFVFEPPPGVKANMLRTFSSIPVSRMCKVGGLQARLYTPKTWGLPSHSWGGTRGVFPSEQAHPTAL